jgi:putative DNA-invertase from lambdoid prophage Rac
MLIQHYTLTQTELGLVQEKTAAYNQLGLALQLCLIRHLGRSWQYEVLLPAPMVAFVAEQIDVQTTMLAEYGRRSQTRREHAIEAQRHLGLHPAGREDRRAALLAAITTAAATDQGKPIAEAGHRPPPEAARSGIGGCEHGATLADRPQRSVRKLALQYFGRGPYSGHPFRAKTPMPRTFAYVRVSTISQTTDNQIQEIQAAGFKVEPRRVVTETISGSVATAQRRGFTRLLDRLEPGDVLIVTKLDRLGRNAMDVSSTVTKLAGIGVRVHCLALGGVDLASSTGKLTMHVINAVAEFERDLLIERTQAGLNRAKAEGKTLGRPASLNDDQRRDVAQRLKDGAGVSALSRAFKTSRQTIMRIRDGASAA